MTPESPEEPSVELETESDVGHDAAPEPVPDAANDFGPPFETKSFGAAFVWARTPTYVATVLRIREGENVAVSTQGRRDMVAMLTGGRAVLEVRRGEDLDLRELQPTDPVPIEAECTYRLIAMTEVELFTVYALL